MGMGGNPPPLMALPAATLSGYGTWWASPYMENKPVVDVAGWDFTKSRCGSHIIGSNYFFHRQAFISMYDLA